MSALLVVGLVLPALAAALLIRAVWPDRVGLPAALWVGLALGFGVGLSAGAYWLALLVGGASRMLVVSADLGVLLFAAALWWRRRPADPGAGREAIGALSGVLVIVVLAAASAALVAFVISALDRQHGEWDAWAIWNLRARFLFRAGDQWRQAFAPAVMHADYPPLLPAAVAHAWAWAGAESTAAPIALAFVFTLALVLLVAGAIAALRDDTLALLGAACVLGTPVLLQRAAWQYADIPLAVWLLAAVALLALADRAAAATTGRPAGTGLLALAGAAGGCAACTKNEGALFLLAIALARAAVALRAGFLDRRRAAAFVVGLTPPLLLLGHFKLALAPPSYLFADQGLAAYLARLADPSRYLTIGAAFVAELARSLGVLALALPLAALVLGRTGERGARQAAAWIGATVGLIAAGFGLVYLVTPLDLAWQLHSSLDRLVLQLWPSALFAALLYVASPRDIVSPVRDAAG